MTFCLGSSLALIIREQLGKSLGFTLVFGEEGHVAFDNDVKFVANIALVNDVLSLLVTLNPAIYQQIFVERSRHLHLNVVFYFHGLNFVKRFKLFEDWQHLFYQIRSTFDFLQLQNFNQALVFNFYFTFAT